jgi:hypothetical protein
LIAWISNGDACAVGGLSATRKSNNLAALAAAHLTTRPSLAPPIDAGAQGRRTHVKA